MPARPTKETNWPDSSMPDRSMLRGFIEGSDRLHWVLHDVSPADAPRSLIRQDISKSNFHEIYGQAVA